MKKEFDEDIQIYKTKLEGAQSDIKNKDEELNKTRAKYD